MSEGEGAYMRQVRQALGGQWAPMSTGGEGTRILYRCGRCARVWYQDGARAPRLDLSPSEIVRLSLELSAHLSELPAATCRICASAGLGVVEIDQYSTGARLGGFGFSVEGVTPPGMHFLASVLLYDWLRPLRTPPHARPVTEYAAVRAVIDWMARFDMPLSYHPITRAEGEQMTRANKPGHNAPGTELFIWRGADWQAKCPPLDGGLARVTLAQAMPPDEPFSFRLCFDTWRTLAKQIQQGHITGEPTAGGIEQ